MCVCVCDGLVQGISKLSVSWFLPFLLFSQIGPLATPSNLGSCEPRLPFSQEELHRDPLADPFRAACPVKTGSSSSSRSFSKHAAGSLGLSGTSCSGCRSGSCERKGTPGSPAFRAGTLLMPRCLLVRSDRA